MAVADSVAKASASQPIRLPGDRSTGNGGAAAAAVERGLGRRPAWVVRTAVRALTGCMALSLLLMLLNHLLLVHLPTSFAADAGLDAAADALPQPAKPTVKVVVVGGGLAGLSAAVEIVKRGGMVTIVEKWGRLGGNSAKASSGINAAQSTSQIAAGIEDSFEDFVQDTEVSGKGRSVKELVDVLVSHAPDAIAFLQSFGIDLSEISQCGGHSHPRTHRSRPDGKVANVGWRIMSALIKFVEAQPPEQVQLLTQTTAKHLVLDNKGHVVGVHCEVLSTGKSGDRIVESVDVFGDAVLLATGGFSSDRQGLLQKYAPDVMNLATTNGAWATGDGVKMAEAIGAALVDMDQVQVHPTGFVDPKDASNPTKFLAPEALRAVGGVLLNHEGKRFVNELATRDTVTAAIMEHCAPLASAISRHAGGASDGPIPKAAFMLLTDGAVEKFDRAVANFYASKNLIHKYDSVKALCDTWQLPFEAVAAELARYGSEPKDEFGKTLFPVKFNLSDALYGSIVTPSLHYTMGGVRLNTQGQLLDASLRPIPGLFGAGEVTGGVHGSNRLAGNSLLECVVFGRIAAVNAWKSKMLHETDIRRHRSFVDRRGLLHETGLDPYRFTPLNLLQRYTPNRTCAILRFRLPSLDHSLGLLCGQYLAVKVSPGPGKDPLVQYYSPMTPPDQYGYFDLVIKHQGAPEGSMPDHLMKMKIGDTAEFAGPLGGFEYEPNMYKSLGMIAGGTGVSPMLQIIRTVIRHPSDNTHLSLLLGNVVEDDILRKEELMYYATTRENVDINIYLEQPPVRWSQGRGRIPKQAVLDHMPPPGSDSRIIMCGPPPMMRVMKGYLRELGYTDLEVYCFNDPDPINPPPAAPTTMPVAASVSHADGK